MAEETGQRASTRAKTAPDPEDPRKPDSLTEIEKPSWKYVGLKTLREFTADQCTDLAAALTYYGVLAVFPALLAFVSLLGLFGDPQQTTDALLDLVGGLVPADTLEAVREPIESIASAPAAGLGLFVGIAGALWSASGYVGAFARAMNRIYAIQEGRPVWKLRPITLGVTVVAILFAVIAAVLLVVSGPIAENVAATIGVGGAGLLVWNIVKWPILAVLAALVVALLYYATPNVQQPKFRWMSLGALVALLVWVIASAGFAFYAANFSSYDETYGSIGGVIVFLLWIWISNLALLFGAELDAELERGRELQAGIAAEEHIQLPPRDTKVSDKAAKQHRKDVAAGRALRGQVDPVGVSQEIADEEKKNAAAEKKAAAAEKKAKSRGTREEQEAALKRAGLALHATSLAQTKGILDSAKLARRADRKALKLQKKRARKNK
ncbi:YhjD/YihY/BrkB family envelope integrity protein [Glaciihabitans arcticus]|uniref:YhjD/YihY/BrkB family envelope integrity protein n=1 Tax=Glaciihabitans arcticus TaxID=2668039 RepID=UPI00195B5F1C